MQNPCLEAIVKDPHHPHDFLRDLVVPQDHPQHLLIHRIKSLFKCTKTRYSPVFHSEVCSTIILSVAIWSQQDLSLRNPACSSRSLSSGKCFILSSTILQITLLSTESCIKSLQFFHRDRSPFLGSLTKRSSFQS